MTWKDRNADDLHFLAVVRLDADDVQSMVCDALGRAPTDKELDVVLTYVDKIKLTSRCEKLCVDALQDMVDDAMRQAGVEA